MIYTSYFANILNFPDNFIPIGICAKPPSWFTGYNEKRFAPSYSILMDYKQNHDDLIYDSRYTNEILNTIDVVQIINYLQSQYPDQSIVLCCYEKSEEFCHRHLLANRLKELGIEVEEFDKTKDYNNIDYGDYI